MKNFDFVGKKFNRLLVIKKTNRRRKGSGDIYWKCRCDCGTFSEVTTSDLKRIKSCGCITKEWNIKSKTTHNLSRSRFYRIWMGMCTRCTNHKTSEYPQYGGRGIENLWNSFEEFRDDMYESYLIHTKENGEKQTTVDRINNNGNYCKENCRWADLKEQQNNRKITKFVTFKGKTLTISEWARKFKIPYGILYKRLKRGINFNTQMARKNKTGKDR